MSRDPEVIRVLRPTLEKMAIEVEVCRGARSGNEIVSTEKFDAIIVDCDDLQGGLDVLRELRKTASNKSSATFAILNGKTNTQQAFEMGANFVLQKPISALSATRCFSAALNMMTRERRRYFRYPVEITVTVSLGQGEELKAVSTNIRFRGKLPNGKISKVHFTVPGTSAELGPKGEMAWSDGSGRCGIRFVDLPENARERLENWLAERMQQMAQVATAETQKPESAKLKAKR